MIGAAGVITAALIETGKLFPGNQDPAGTIEAPAKGARVAREFTVAGTLSDIPDDERVWLAVQVGNLLYPKEPEIGSFAGHFSQQIVEGGNPPDGRFSVVLLRVDREGQAEVRRWISAVDQGREPPGLLTIPGADVLDAVADLRLRE